MHFNCKHVCNFIRFNHFIPRKTAFMIKFQEAKITHPKKSKFSKKFFLLQMVPNGKVVCNRTPLGQKNVRFALRPSVTEITLYNPLLRRYHLCDFWTTSRILFFFGTESKYLQRPNGRFGTLWVQIGYQLENLDVYDQ